MKLTDAELLEEIKKRFEEKQDSLQELENLTSQLQTVNKKLAESEALKTHFISNITNEIVNPFASILGLSKNIIAARPENYEKIRSMAVLIHSEAFSLDFQLKNIFAAAEIEAGEIIPQSLIVDVNKLTNGVIDQFEHEIEKKQLKVEFKSELVSDNNKPRYFRTDHEKLQLILSNLLSNAIKYSNATNKIIIRAKSDNEGKLIMSVQDFGIGITESNQRIIFDRFRRIDSGINSLNRGHGLGLSVIKAYLDLLEGEIDIKSREKQGSVFTITIPEMMSSDEMNGFSSDGNEIFFTDEEDEIF